jgi:hypothetical protein
MTVAHPPDCPVCGWNDQVVCASRLWRNGEVVTERWICVGCQKIIGLDSARRLNKRLLILGLAVVMAFPTVWWRYRVQRPTTRRAA